MNNEKKVEPGKNFISEYPYAIRESHLEKFFQTNQLNQIFLFHNYLKLNVRIVIVVTTIKVFCQNF